MPVKALVNTPVFEHSSRGGLPLETLSRDTSAVGQPQPHGYRDDDDDDDDDDDEAAATRGASFRLHPQGRLHLSLLPTDPKRSSSSSRSLFVEQADALLEMALLKWKLASWMTKRDMELFLSSPLLTDPAKDNRLC
ncbi:hypothetical protein ACFX2I_027876 [Malus domestica]